MNIMRKIYSADNKSIYKMTKEETMEDKKACIKMVVAGFAYGVGGFCTLWVAVALYITAAYPAEIPIPIVVNIEEDMVQLEEEIQKAERPPITIPSQPTEDKWITIKRRVE